jgi:subtilisin family serine protease
MKPFSPGTHLRNKKSLPQTAPYGIAMVQAPFAWKHGIRGKDVKVCVIDSGATLHEDLNQTSLNGAVASTFWDRGDGEWFLDR